MAVAAFKSSTRRATNPSSPSLSDRESRDPHQPTSPRKPVPPPSSSSSSSSSTKKAPPRRSRSVSAVSRTQLEASTGLVSASPTDFLIKRDNPLYWSSTSPPDNDEENEIAAKNAFLKEPTKSKSPTRGRSGSRNPDTVKNVVRTSQSRVDTGRRNRSVSRGPATRGRSVNPESDVEEEVSLLTKGRNRNGASAASNVFGSSFSDAEERTIGAVCEQMKSFQGDSLGDGAPSHIYETVRSEVKRAIADIQNDLGSTVRRSNASAIATASVTDIPPDLVNPSAVELILDIRREYANKLEESQERARKLRADLAVEEHRGLELTRILKEVLPDPKAANVQKSRPGRKSSIERRKMSKRLSEEAMAYFDECVSISTFDSSDFSSPEDPPFSLGVAIAPLDSHRSSLQASSSIAVNHFPSTCVNDRQESSITCSSHDAVDALQQLATGSSREPIPDEISLSSSLDAQSLRSCRFSFAYKHDDASESQEDIRNYARYFEKGIEKVDMSSHTSRSNRCDLDEYNLHASQQSLLFDRVFFKSQIESGSMLLCGGSGFAVSFSSFASVI